MKSTLLRLIPVLLFTPAICKAGLIGDTVRFDGCYPDSTICSFLGDRLVTADTSDSVTYGVSTTDVNDSTIIFSAGQGYAINGSFNGVIVSNLDWIGEPNRILSGFNVLSDTFFDVDIAFSDRHR